MIHLLKFKYDEINNRKSTYVLLYITVSCRVCFFFLFVLFGVLLLAIFKFWL